MTANTNLAPQGRRDVRKQKRREAILKAARASFLKHGYAATSMSAIVADLGGSKATLWSYFPSKEDLFAAVVDDATAAFRNEIVERLNMSCDLRGGLTDFCGNFLRKIVSPEALALHRLVASESGRFPEVGAIFYRRVVRVMELELSGFIEHHMKQGNLIADDPQTAARMIMALCINHQQRALWGIELFDDGKVATAAKAVVDVFLRAFRVGDRC